MSRKQKQLIIAVIAVISILIGIFLTITSSIKQHVAAADTFSDRCTCENPSLMWTSIILDNGIQGHAKVCLICGKQNGNYGYCSDSLDRDICDICGIPLTKSPETCNHTTTRWIYEINNGRLGHRRQCTSCERFTTRWEACKDENDDQKCDKCGERSNNFAANVCYHGVEIWQQKKSTAYGARPCKNSQFVLPGM